MLDALGLPGLPSMLGPAAMVSSLDPSLYRKFVVGKALTLGHLQVSLMFGIWAVHSRHAPKLLELFESCDEVVLVASVNNSYQFQVRARMHAR